MTDPWTDRLSEYLDEELNSTERAAIETHLAVCPDCVATLAQLRRVAARARGLEELPPTVDLWPAIAERIGPGFVNLATRRPRARRFSFSIPQLVAAGLALMLASGGSAALVLRSWEAGRGPSPAAGSQPRVQPVESDLVSGRAYAVAVADLQDVLRRERGQLDTTTVRILDEKLRLIDRAIAEAQRALETDPNSVYLHDHLTRTRQRKLELLRRAAVLATAAS